MRKSIAVFLITFRVLNNARDFAFHDGDGRVGGTQVDTDDGTLDLAIALGSSRRLIASETGSEGGSVNGSRASGKGGSSGKL